MEEIGQAGRGGFVDLDNQPIELMFKLYPWEWMMRETFGASLPGAPTQFVEPPWKAILSNKAILPLLWAMFPNHPNLLPAYFEGDPKAAELGTSYARKPLYSREGANVELIVDGKAVDRTTGPTAPKASSARPSRRCRSSTATTRCSAPGSPPASLAGSTCARTRARSPRTRRASCRTRSSDRWIAPIRLAARSGQCPNGAMNPRSRSSRFMTFSSALSVRAVDPMIPQIAHDFWLPPATAAMLAAAFISYGMVLPVLGPVADSVGKKRVMIGCLIVLTVSSFLCAVATTFQQLFWLRVIAGAGCGGLFPLGMAMLSDLVPLAQRQVAIGRLLAGTITGNLLGSAAAGVVADFIHWRGVFIVLGVDLADRLGPRRGRAARPAGGAKASR